MRTQQAYTILKLFICHLMFLGAGMGYGMAQDTTAVRADQKQRLGPVVVRQSKKPSPTLAQAPVQVVDIEKMERHGALLLSDAVRQMAGVTLRDYGGVGGSSAPSPSTASPSTTPRTARWTWGATCSAARHT